MSSNGDALIREAISAYRENNQDEARQLLLQAVEADDQNEQAWLWLSAVVDTVEDQQTCLENVLTINPDNEKARQGLQILGEKSGGSPAVTSPEANSPPPAEDDPFAGASFTQTDSAPEATAPTFATPDNDDDDDELPADTQWGLIETSSASAQQPDAAGPSTEEYDSWVTGLNLGNNEAADTFGDIPTDDEPSFSASPFIGGESLNDDETPFEVDDNPFGQAEDSFQTTPAATEATEEVFSASPFATDIDFPDEAEEDLAPAPPPTAASIMSPSLETDDDDDATFDGLDVGDDFDDFDDDYDDADFDNVDPEELFRFIPTNIKATRLPGTRERYPAPVIISLVLLLVFNIGALALVVITLTGG